MVVPYTNVFESPREDAKAIAVAGHEIVAVTEATDWSAPSANGTWVTVRWDRTTAYMRRRDLYGPNDPGLCLDRENGSWQIVYFRTQYP